MCKTYMKPAVIPCVVYELFPSGWQSTGRNTGNNTVACKKKKSVLQVF